jgi:hypothetical protein
VLRAYKCRGETDIETNSLRFEFATSITGFIDPLIGKIDVAPSRKKILQIPFTLTMAQKHENPAAHFVSPMIADRQTEALI